jgi:hypothetical protein
VVQLRNRDRAPITGGDAVGFVITAGGSAVADPPDRGNEVIGVEGGLGPALNDSFLNHLHGVFGQQLQDPNVLPRTRLRAVTLFQDRPQLVEAGRQLPLIEHEGMIQSRRPTTEERQIMLRLDDPFPSGKST